MNANETAKRLFGTSALLRKLREHLGPDGFAFLCHALTSLDRILPHTVTDRWLTSSAPEGAATRVTWQDSKRRAIVIRLVLSSETGVVQLSSSLRRRTALHGVGVIARTLDKREFDLTAHVATRVSQVLRPVPAPGQGESLRAIQGRFDEQIVSAHLKKHHGLRLDVGLIFSEMRHLAEQSYENKSLAYGVVLRADKRGGTAVFPSEFLEKKRYRAMSDGYRTAFSIGSDGQLIGLIDLQATSPDARRDHFCPEWCRFIAEAATGSACSICLTRQGDILVFDSGNLRFTYRVGRWQYWNHGHVCDLLRNRARVQRVPRTVLPKVVRSIYRSALDVSFRHSGALFVLLRSRANKPRLLVEGDAIGDRKREPIYQAFDQTLGEANILTMSRAVLAELAGIDGGVVLDNTGRVLAYGAVLKTKGKAGPSEGSRTKAAIAASRYGIAVKVSADGDIAFFEKGKAFLQL